MIECRKCGQCCRELTLPERVKVIWYTRKFQFGRECKLLDSDSLCSIYEMRPKFCKLWVCEVYT